jgi:mannosyltransferase OCH1-like enzyme
MILYGEKRIYIIIEYYIMIFNYIVAIIVITGIIYLLYITYSFEIQIPKKIFQTWHTNELPPLMKQCTQKLREDNPEFEYYLYNDQECRKFIEDNYDKSIVEAYDILIPGAFKADLWRYCVLYKYGGIYLDIKYQCENGFKLIHLLEDTSTWVKENDNRVVYTGLLVCEPNNKKMWNCIQQIVKNVKNKYYGRECTSPTGPDLFEKYFTEYEKNKIHFYYYDEYYPNTEIEKRGFIKDLNTDEIILSHYPEYRKEQKQFGKTEYWVDLWRKRNIYN